MLKSDSIAWIPRGLRREEAARYVGVSPAKFDEMIRDRQMPKPRQAGGRVIWDRAELDMAFSELPHQSSENKLDRIFAK